MNATKTVVDIFYFKYNSISISLNRMNYFNQLKNVLGVVLCLLMLFLHPSPGILQLCAVVLIPFMVIAVGPVGLLSDPSMTQPPYYCTKSLGGNKKRDSKYTSGIQRVSTFI